MTDIQISIVYMSLKNEKYIKKTCAILKKMLILRQEQWNCIKVIRNDDTWNLVPPPFERMRDSMFD